MTYFDGHLHSTSSDGLLAPAAVVDAVARVGTRVLALTDHDTFDGHAEARARAGERGLEFVPGVEMSVDGGARELHVLAYFVQRDGGPLTRALDEALARRATHLDEMLARLDALGYPLTAAEVLAQAAGRSVGRPHIARALVARGAFRTVDDAFDRLLGEGKPGRVRRPLPDVATMVAHARAAGGVCSVAHPGVHDLRARDLERLRDLGVDGIEVWHPDHDNSDVVFYLRECARLGMVPTGGSDDHGVTPLRPGQPGLDEKGFAKLVARRR